MAFKNVNDEQVNSLFSVHDLDSNKTPMMFIKSNMSNDNSKPT